MRVLLVDDEEELVSTLAERLAMRGIEAEWVSDPERALELVTAGNFDVAVLDVKVPKISGLELKKKLEEIDPRLKFIFMTGHGSESDFRKGVAEAGSGFYLIKPVKIELLIDRIHGVLKEDQDGHDGQ
jgi:DNA-binding response OmpR family regulator